MRRSPAPAPRAERGRRRQPGRAAEISRLIVGSRGVVLARFLIDGRSSSAAGDRNGAPHEDVKSRRHVSGQGCSARRRSRRAQTASAFLDELPRRRCRCRRRGASAATRTTRPRRRRSTRVPSATRRGLPPRPGDAADEPLGAVGRERLVHRLGEVGGLGLPSRHERLPVRASGGSMAARDSRWTSGRSRRLPRATPGRRRRSQHRIVSRLPARVLGQVDQVAHRRGDRGGRRSADRTVVIGSTQTRPWADTPSTLAQVRSSSTYSTFSVVTTSIDVFDLVEPGRSRLDEAAAIGVLCRREANGSRSSSGREHASANTMSYPSSGAPKAMRPFRS